MNLWLYSLRDMAHRPGRSLLTFFSIVLGVGTVFAVSATITGAQAAYRKLTETVSGKADAQVVTRGGGRFARDQVAFIEKSPQVQVAVPSLSQAAMLYAGKEKVQINGVGTLVEREKKLRPFDVLSGRLIENENEILLEESLAQSVIIKAGDDIKILSRRGVEDIHVAGLIRPTEVWAFTQGGLAYLNLADWQYLSKADGKIDTLQIILAPGADKNKVLGELSAQLPADLQLRRTEEDRASSNVTLIAFQYGLEATRSLALVVAALLILNTFQMNVTERSGQIAVLRMIGAMRSQVMRLFLREGRWSASSGPWSACRSAGCWRAGCRAASKMPLPSGSKKRSSSSGPCCFHSRWAPSSPWSRPFGRRTVPRTSARWKGCRGAARPRRKSSAGGISRWAPFCASYRPSA